ncbi:hypothetical protein PIROE2DRAFT_17749 [Piromyces sp. E2]|nr:hypothetical protein PIROE2DRAFT_17749 [Piromyces sp. E2]|eukprot:OUM57311.1 hypothetical protein PIROE2DRAFT_17749 [Piromyces sp. E2]
MGKHTKNFCITYKYLSLILGKVHFRNGILVKNNDKLVYYTNSEWENIAKNYV